MDKYYGKKDKKIFTRESIIGLGEESFRKNYYPELQEKINDLEQMNARNRSLISTIPDILLVCSPDGSIAPVSFLNQVEKPMKNEILTYPEIMDILDDGVKEAIHSRNIACREFQLLYMDETYYFEARFHKSEINEVLIMIRDMTERFLLIQQLRDLAERDTLTGLYNRRSFENKLNEYNGKPINQIAMISIDINGLKFINDTLGHFIGDNMIITAGHLIFQEFSAHGHVARIGGDEFGIILDGIEENQVEIMLNQLSQTVEQYSLTAKECGLSLAYGYAYHKTGIVNMGLMYQEADNNMYQNKLLKKESIRSTFVKTFMKALEAKDYVSEGHVGRMEQLARYIGEALYLKQDQMDRLVLLTKFHDIGKIGIPDSILKKPDKLTEDEWKVMRTHSAIGERIANEAAEIKEIAHLILKHHEKWDGTGYPLGLAGNDIPTECRILAIVDTFDAMTNDRPYRAAATYAVAVNEIVRCSGSQFDPRLVDVFCKIYHKN